MYTCIDITRTVLCSVYKCTVCEYLGQSRFICFIVSMATVTNQVDHDVFSKCSPPLGRQPTDVHYCLWIISIHMKNRGRHHLHCTCTCIHVHVYKCTSYKCIPVCILRCTMQSIECTEHIYMYMYMYICTCTLYIHKCAQGTCTCTCAGLMAGSSPWQRQCSRGRSELPGDQW